MEVNIFENFDRKAIFYFNFCELENQTFIQYQITPSNTSRAVLRRYKHFDWLHDQLTRKYASVCIIPPLPGKQVTGRYEDDFVSDRMSRLQVLSSFILPIMLELIVAKHELRNLQKGY